MNSRSSASMCSGCARHPTAAPPAAGSSPVSSSCHQWSRPGDHRWRVASASSADPARHDHVVDARATPTRRRRRCALRPTGSASPPATVGGDHHPGLRRRGSGRAARPRRSPPNTTEWTAPMRVQASMATAARGSSACRWPPGRPGRRRGRGATLANRDTSTSSSAVGDGPGVARLTLPVEGHLVAPARRPRAGRGSCRRR